MEREIEREIERRDHFKLMCIYNSVYTSKVLLHMYIHCEYPN